MKNIFSFFDINYDENFFENIFKVLKKNLDFEYGFICYNGEKPQYIYGKSQSLNVLKADLIIRNTKFGEILISSETFSKEDEITFKSCAVVISNIIKDYEISNIMKMQVEALQDGYLKIKQSEAVKTKFVSHMSHELRTPLNAILGFSDLLASEFVGSLNEKQKEYVNDIKVSGLNLLGMINEVLDMSKIESNTMKFSPREFLISQLLCEIENIIQPLLIKNKIQLKKDEEDFLINTDYQKLQQILLNLLSNAIKYTKNVIFISVKKDNHYAVISVEDNGKGIAQENFDKIFEKFEQLNSGLENSTGLGLTITKELVKLLGGTIEVQSKIKNGAKFIIKIPL